MHRNLLRVGVGGCGGGGLAVGLADHVDLGITADMDGGGGGLQIHLLPWGSRVLGNGSHIAVFGALA